jgi:hypothetical protein
MVSILGDAGQNGQTAHIVDVSQHGAMLQCRHSLPLYAIVRIVIANQEAVGQVVRVQKIRTAWFRRNFLIGVKLKRPWTGEMFRHLAFPDADFSVKTDVGDDDDFFSKMVY